MTLYGAKMLTRYDKALIIFLLAFAALSLAGVIFINKAGSEVKQAVISSRGEEAIYLPLQGREKQIRIKGCLLEIARGRVRVVTSSCPNKICVATGWISEPTQIIVCVPHGVMVRIEGKTKKSKLDAVSK